MRGRTQNRPRGLTSQKMFAKKCAAMFKIEADLPLMLLSINVNKR